MSGTCRMLSWFGDLKVTALILVHRIFWNISISLESCKRREFRWGWCSFLLHKTMVFITVTKPWLLRGNLPAILVCRVLFHENFATTQKKAIQEHAFFPEHLHSRSSRGACTDWSKISGVFVAVWQRPHRSAYFSRLSPTMSNATVTILDCSCTSGIWHSSGSSHLSLDLLTTRN